MIGVAISFRLHTEPSVDPPEFTVTCRSRGGPATTVEWSIDGVPVQEDSNHMTNQIIVDTSRNTVYDNTLRVRGRQPGRYRCTISNSITSIPGTETLTIESKNMHYETCHHLSLLFILSCTHTYSTQCYIYIKYQCSTGVDQRHTITRLPVCGVL